MTRLYLFIALILALVIISINCERQPSKIEESAIENESQDIGLTKVTVLVDGKSKTNWEMLYCPEGTPDCEPPECVEVPCLQECLEVSGTMHEHRKTFIDASGAMHAHYHVNDSNVKGIALESGTKYNCPYVVNFNFYRDGLTPGNFPYKYHYKLESRLISQGNAPNYLITEMIHITINANGEITARRVFEEFKCE